LKRSGFRGGCGERETRKQKLETRSEKQSQSPSDKVGARAKQRHPLPSYGGQARNKGPRIPIRSGQVGQAPGTLKPKIDKRRDTECAEWARTREIHRMPKPHAMEKSTSHPQADPFAGAKGKEDSACFVRNDGGRALCRTAPAPIRRLAFPGAGELREDNEGAGVTYGAPTALGNRPRAETGRQERKTKSK